MKFKINWLNVFCMLVLFFCFTISAGAREITLTWDANNEPDLSHYIVHWGTETGVYPTKTTENEIGLDTEYKITLPDDGKIYFFVVTAVDNSGLESDYSNEVSSPKNALDTWLYLPPAQVQNLKRSIYQETLPDGSIAVYQGAFIKVTRPDGTVIEIASEVTQ